MSYHIKLKEYNCLNCNAFYIPYEEKLPCPSCNLIPKDISKEYFNFIDELIISLRVNKIREGSYLPSAWYSGSQAENIQLVFFKLFHFLNIKKPRDGEAFINEYFKNFKMEEKELEYMRDYLHTVALKIYSRKKELKVSLWARLLSKIIS